MSTLSSRLFSHDLDFLIAETEEQFTGISPPAIAGIVYRGCLSTIDSGYEVFDHGHEVMLDSSIMLNSNNYSLLPTKGAILRDLKGTTFKVFEVEKEDFTGGYEMKVNSRYARSE